MFQARRLQEVAVSPASTSAIGKRCYHSIALSIFLRRDNRFRAAVFIVLVHPESCAGRVDVLLR